ncbi:MAG TPA: hypothetical protein PLE54_03965 [Burkholderiaceae bacterium]|nr:hypothetical protein [Burkholderiaceae bacterium]HQR69733.1 hypothetical protein [Burkholderiaceae bacterium]
MNTNWGLIDWPASSWLTKQGRVLLAWAVFNPNGPLLLTTGFVDNGAQRHAFLRSQSPRRITAFSLGTVAPDDPAQAEQISKIVNDALTATSGSTPDAFAPFACIPYLVSLPAGAAARAAALGWLQSGVAARDFDWGREFHYLDKYGDDLFARAAEETREALELWRASQPDSEATRQVIDMTHARFGHLRPFADWRPAAWEWRSFDEPGFVRWLAMLSNDRFYSRGFYAFAQAWIGSSRQAATASAAPLLVSFDDLLAYLRHFQHPIWPMEWSEATITSQMKVPGVMQ